MQPQLNLNTIEPKMKKVEFDKKKITLHHHHHPPTHHHRELNVSNIAKLNSNFNFNYNLSWV